MTFVEKMREAWRLHSAAGIEAYEMFKAWAPRTARIPGCDTAWRCAYRIYNGATVEQSAAREYLYRWNLTILSMGNATAPEPRLGIKGRPSPFVDHYAPHILGQ